MLKATIFILLMAGCVLYSQTTFMRTCAQGDYGTNVIQTTDDGFLFSSWSKLPGYGSWDICLLKTDEKGDALWTKVMGMASSNESVEGLIQATDGHYVLAINTTEEGAIGSDIKMVKLNVNGEIIWQHLYSREGDQQCYAGAQLEDGGFVIAGTSNLGSTVQKCFVIRTDADGNRTWDNVVEDDGNNLFRDVIAANDGGFALAGRASNHFVVAKFKNDNTPEWVKKCGEEFCFASSLVQFDDGRFLAVGCTGTSVHFTDNAKILAACMDAEGNELWSKEYGGDRVGAALLAKKTTDGAVAIVGRIKAPQDAYYDIYLAKIDTAGELLWDNTFGGDFDDEGWGLDVTDDGGFVLTGTNFLEGAAARYSNPSQIWLIRTNSEGQLTSVAQEKPLHPQSPVLLQNYPNPFNPSTTIEYTLPQAAQVHLAVYNLRGQIVCELIDEEQSAGVHAILWRGEDERGAQVSSGVYIYRLRARDAASGDILFDAERKMALMR